MTLLRTLLGCPRLLAGGLIVAASAPDALAAETRIDLRRQAQTIRGFGVSMGGGNDANRIEGRDRGESVMHNEDFYDHYVGDLGASVVRTGVSRTVLSKGGKYWPQHADLREPIRLGSDTYANIEAFDFTVKGVGNVGHFVRKAARRGDPMTLMGAIWSPPVWMKGPEVDLGYKDFAGQLPRDTFWNASAAGSLVDTPDNLQQFGRYVAAYAKGFEKAWDRPFDVLSVQNEPRFSTWYDSSVYTPELFAEAVGAVNAAFAEHNAANPDDPILTRVLGPDDLGLGGKGSNLANVSFSYIKEVRHDGDPETAVDVYGMHGYNGGGRFADSDDRIESWKTFRNGRVRDDGYVNYEGVGEGVEFWVTEHSGHRHRWTDPGDTYNGAMGLALEVHEAMVGVDAVGYLYWQHEDWAGRLNNFTLTSGLDENQPKYAAFKHFAKHVRPGMRRVAADVLEDGQVDTSAVKISAYLDEAAGTLTYVLLNVTKVTQAVRLASLAAGGELLEASWSADGAYHQAGHADAGGWLNLQGESIWSVVTTLGSLNAVPEPGTGVAVFAGGALLLRRRRRA
ncbi:PEP-CTERM sorting domain-containing protein [Phycisphaera mikurensis]|uniref:Uncharacterized protein n=1 Tax=Phycisphaera mikurensis (strain NBRC 102666 / KCTC 22515 / FYK2301M01) TaxID=1142394 RepID=I0IIR0_PHYMF|nr:PEP-CTERM sorting domain-containing protein [Phycisphaera mikurensis]MBB6442701.1 O-glycosyl hydrolase [Phycisphaera mikurensis]BAM05148.1 hypothetical protein PSMK_29890 [Phycisphaera mikurensis NBRC 102666]